jgi:thioredoxin reductase
VLVAIGRSGDFRRLGIPGERLDKVFNRLHDPADYRGQEALVVGGGDSALETAIALADAGARVTLCHRGPELARAKRENLERLELLRGAGRLAVRLGTEPEEIRGTHVDVRHADGTLETLPNDVVFTMIGRDPPVARPRRSGGLGSDSSSPRWRCSTTGSPRGSWMGRCGQRGRFRGTLRSSSRRSAPGGPPRCGTAARCSERWRSR